MKAKTTLKIAAIKLEPGVELSFTLSVIRNATDIPVAIAKISITIPQIPIDTEGAFDTTVMYFSAALEDVSSGLKCGNHAPSQTQSIENDRETQTRRRLSILSQMC